MRQFKIIEKCDPSELESELAEHAGQGWDVAGFSHVIDPGSNFPFSFAVLLVRYTWPASKADEAAGAAVPESIGIIGV